MSWTSEFEPPPPRPLLEPEDFSEQGFELVELDHEPSEQSESPHAYLDAERDGGGDGHQQVDQDLDDSGPLDPSVFDGLFDDLTDEDRADDGGESDLERPRETGFDTEPDSHTEPDSDTGEPHAVIDYSEADLDQVEGDLDHDGPYGFDDRLPADDTEPAFDLRYEDSGYEDSGYENNGYAETGEHTAAELDDADVVESSEGLLTEVIQANPGLAETLPEHIEHESFQPADLDELDQLDAAYLEAEPAQSAQPVAQAQALVEQPVVDPFQDLPEAAPLPPAVHYDPTTDDQLVATEQALAPAQHGDSFGGSGVGPDRNGAEGVPVGAVYTAAPPPLHTEPRVQRRWPAFVVATFVGAGLGVVGALVLFQFLRESPTETATPAPETPVRTSVEQTPEPAVDPEPTQAVGLASLADTGRFELNTIRFVPGTAELTEASDAILVEAAAAIADRPEAPLCIDVRTFSEPTAIANRELSGRQGLRVQERLIELGVPASSVMVNPLGAAPLTEIQPVQTFVVPSSGLEPSALRSAAQRVNPFAIGLDPVTNQLRPESIEPLNLLGEAMAADDLATLNLAAYSYGEAGAGRNEEMASIAAEAAAAYLVTNHGIDRTRVTILTLGETPFVVGPAMGGHIFVRWGDGASVNRQLLDLDLAAVSFAPGSAALTPEAAAVLDQIVAVGAEQGVAVVVGVHTSTEATLTANAELSAIQAQVVLDYVATAGATADQIQVYGAGSMRQFEGQDVPSGIVISTVP